MIYVCTEAYFTCVYLVISIHPLIPSVKLCTGWLVQWYYNCLFLYFWGDGVDGAMAFSDWRAISSLSLVCHPSVQACHLQGLLISGKTCPNFKLKLSPCWLWRGHMQQISIAS